MEHSKPKEREVENLLLKKDSVLTKDSTFLQKLKTLKSNITVEPVLGFFVIPTVLAMLAKDNLNLEKACKVNFNYTDAICTALKRRKTANFKEEEIIINELIGTINAWKEFIHTFVPTVLMLFLGAWSDKTGRRKICMLMPIVGEFMTCFINLFNTYFFYEVPLRWTAFMEVIFSSLGGEWYFMFLGTFSYICDITSKETRTFRLGLLNLCFNIGFPIGMALSGVILRYLGYYGVFAVSGTIHFFNFCYVLFYIEDHTCIENKETEATTECTSITRFLRNFFDFKALKDTFNVVFQKGINNRRVKLCLILFLVCMNFGPIWGELSIKYLYTRYRFQWNEVKYSIFATFNFVTHSVGTLFAITVLIKKLGFEDATLGITATISKICGALMLAFARNGNQAFLAPLLTSLDGPATIAERSMSSKLVNPQELGKMYSLIGLVESLMRLIFAPLYSAIYSATLQILPGTVFLLTVALTTPALIVFIWFYFQHKKDKKKKKPNDDIDSILDNTTISMKDSV